MSLHKSLESNININYNWSIVRQKKGLQHWSQAAFLNVSWSRAVRFTLSELEFLPLQVGFHDEEGGKVERVQGQVDSGLQEAC